MQDPIEIHRAIARLDQLSQHGAQSFGRNMQRLLAFAFESSDFRVIQNSVGVPDFIAQLINRDTFQSIAVEVKTSLTGKVTIEERDLAGVVGVAPTPIVAVLDFPARIPRWLFINAESLLPRVWEMRRLARKELVELEVDIEGVFFRLLGELPPRVLDGTVPLNSWLDETRRRHAGLDEQGR